MCSLNNDSYLLMVLVWLCWVFTNLSAIFEKRIMRIGKGISVKIFAIQVQVSITRWVIVECLMCRNILISCKESLHLWDFRWSGHTMMNGDSLWVGELEFGNNFPASTFVFNFFLSCIQWLQNCGVTMLPSSRLYHAVYTPLCSCTILQYHLTPRSHKLNWLRLAARVHLCSELLNSKKNNLVPFLKCGVAFKSKVFVVKCYLCIISYFAVKCLVLVAS